jgi:hypothetical protein
VDFLEKGNNLLTNFSFDLIGEENSLIKNSIEREFLIETLENLNIIGFSCEKLFNSEVNGFDINEFH